MHQNLGILDAVAGTHSRSFGRLFRHPRIGQTLNGPTFVADKMSVFVVAGIFQVAHPISPNLVIPPNPVQKLLLRQGIERPVQRYPVDPVGKSFQNLPGAQRLTFMSQNFQHLQAHRRAPKAGLMERVGRFPFGFGHGAIISPIHRDDMKLGGSPGRTQASFLMQESRFRVTISPMPLDDILIDAEMHMEKATDHLLQELRGIRTGRASPGLVEHIKVEYYGSPTDLRSIAAISIPEATQILIKPFSPGDMRAIEKAINDSKLGLTPHSDGKQLRLVLPSLSQERRLQLAGQCKHLAETAKVAIRNARRDANKVLETEEKGGLVTEDDSTKGKEQIQELTKTYETKVDEVVEKKRVEIMQI